MLTKNQVINTVNNFSSTIKIDELIDKLIFVEKVEKGLNDVKEKRISNSVDSKKKLSKWLK